MYELFIEFENEVGTERLNSNYRKQDYTRQLVPTTYEN
jgi:hypothetical protein